MTDIFLYPSEPNPNDVRLRDPTAEPSSGTNVNVTGEGVFATGAVGTGTVTASCNVVGVGVTATGAVGAGTITAAANVVGVGVAGTGAIGAGTITADANVTGVGVFANGQLGTGTVVISDDVDVDVIGVGVSATGQPGEGTVVISGTPVIINAGGGGAYSVKRPAKNKPKAKVIISVDRVVSSAGSAAMSAVGAGHAEISDEQPTAADLELIRIAIDALREEDEKAMMIAMIESL